MRIHSFFVSMCFNQEEISIGGIKEIKDLIIPNIIIEEPTYL